jgi:phage tail sheath gpL-like
MSGTVVLTINTSRTDIADRLVKDVSLRHEWFSEMTSYLKALDSRVEDGTVHFQYNGSAAPVAASGTLTLTYNSITASDTVVIAGVTLTAVTGTPSTDEFKKETSATKTASNLVAAIQANATLNAILDASSALGVVTVAVKQKGVLGNQVTLVGSAGMVASAAKLAGGTGGATSVAVSF